MSWDWSLNGEKEVMRFATWMDGQLSVPGNESEEELIRSAASRYFDMTDEGLEELDE